MPAGIAVWVTEKANGAYRRTAQRPSNCELAGVATAATPLPTSADSTNPAAPPSTATAMPPPVNSSAIWLMRIAPWRMMNPPDPSWPKSAAMATRPKSTPTQDGSAWSSSMINGASTAGNTRPTEPQVCCENIARTAISMRVN